MPTQKLTGAAALVRCLELEGVEYVFGHPGGATLPIYDALYHAEKLRHILVRHEQAGAHMAEGYARATGKVGVCMATSGPGATNLVTGIADAYMDSTPLVAITGNVARQMIGTDAFQEADIVSITMPITKHNWLVTDANDLPRIIKEAFHVARSGRPGPVLVDIPKDIQNTVIDFEYPKEVSGPRFRTPPKPDSKEYEAAAALIRTSSRPVFYLGGGIHCGDAYAEVRELVELVGAPTVTTVHGKGALPESHPQSLAMFGMHGAKFANYAVQGSDLLVAVGARFDDRVTGRLADFAPHAKVVHLDIDPAEISKNVTANVSLVGDVKETLPELIAACRRSIEKFGKTDLSAWWKQVHEWREKHPLRYKQEGETLLPQYVIEQLWKKTKGEAIVATGVGEHQMFAAQYYRTSKPRQFLTSGGLGTMGFCLPAAIGAQFGKPDELVIGIDGDGSFQMTLQDLATASKAKLPIKMFIINNMYLGMVRQWQELFFEERYSQVMLGDCPDFVKLAEAYGCLGLRATNPTELAAVIDRALAHNDGPVIVDVRVKEDECCFPIVRPGGALDDILEAE
jgi:acetolactate synthase-1/2/3 large subunit